MNVLYKYEQTKDDYHKLCNGQLGGGGDNDNQFIWNIVFLVLGLLNLFGILKLNNILSTNIKQYYERTGQYLPIGEISSLRSIGGQVAAYDYLNLSNL